MKFDSRWSFFRVWIQIESIYFVHSVPSDLCLSDRPFRCNTIKQFYKTDFRNFCFSTKWKHKNYRSHQCWTHDKEDIMELPSSDKVVHPLETWHQPMRFLRWCGFLGDCNFAGSFRAIGTRYLWSRPGFQAMTLIFVFFRKMELRQGSFNDAGAEAPTRSRSASQLDSEQGLDDWSWCCMSS